MKTLIISNLLERFSVQQIADRGKFNFQINLRFK
jgi:hypothetical protein